MKLWLDAQLPPALARWINDQEFGLAAIPIRDIGLRDASDRDIFFKARLAGSLVMTKDRDFIQLLNTEGPPPQIIWLRLGNSSNAALQAVLSTTLTKAIELLQDGETWVEIRQSSHGN
jgi:predicted nuclease of predicted toxin-antitoxin system